MYFLHQRMTAYASVCQGVCQGVCQRLPACFKRIKPMHNVPLAYVSVYQRMSDMFHMLTYASTIRYSVTAMLQSEKTAVDIGTLSRDRDTLDIRNSYATHTLVIRRVRWSYACHTLGTR